MAHHIVYPYVPAGMQESRSCLNFGSPDPSDENVTTRVLTVRGASLSRNVRPNGGRRGRSAMVA